MITVSTIEKYDNYIEEQIEQAKEDYPGYLRYEICSNGELFLWSLGSYPSIIKNYCEPIDIC